MQKFKNFVFKRKDDNNIFKSKEDDKVFKDSSQCFLLNYDQHGKSYFFKDTQNCVHRIFFTSSGNEYQYESSVYLNLLKQNSGLTVLMSPVKKNEMLYFTNDFCSLRHFLKTQAKHQIQKILFAVFEFINTFRNYNFIHGNLHLDNIFILTDNNDKEEFTFKVIDFTNSHVKDTSIHCKHDRTSIFGDHDLFMINYWDFFCLFANLRIFFKSGHFKKDIQMIIKKYIDLASYARLCDKFKVIRERKEYIDIVKKYSI